MTEVERFKRATADAIDAGRMDHAANLARRGAELRLREIERTSPKCCYCGDALVHGVAAFDGQLKFCEPCTSLGD